MFFLCLCFGAQTDLCLKFWRFYDFVLFILILILKIEILKIGILKSKTIKQLLGPLLYASCRLVLRISRLCRLYELRRCYATMIVEATSNVEYIFRHKNNTTKSVSQWRQANTIFASSSHNTLAPHKESVLIPLLFPRWVK